jgi:hypothetical protein
MTCLLIVLPSDETRLEIGRKLIAVAVADAELARVSGDGARSFGANAAEAEYGFEYRLPNRNEE